MITFLQLSDIHFHKDAPDDDLYRQMKTRLKSDIKNQRVNYKFDYILICGDIAFSGTEDQYKEAHMFLKGIKEVSECTTVFTVPGNHDLQRSCYHQFRDYFRPAILKDANHIFSECRKNQPLILKAIYSPFEEYYKFANKEKASVCGVADAFFIRKGELTQNDLFYWSSIIGEENGYTIKLIGVNTAILASELDSSPTSKQVLPFQMINETRDVNEINILMAHHPLSFIKKSEVIKPEIDKRFNVQFYGHVHKQSSQLGSSCVIQSGALQPDQKDDTDDYKPVYNIVTLEVHDSKISLYIISRKWNGQNFVQYKKKQFTYPIEQDPEVDSSDNCGDALKGELPSEKEVTPKTIILTTYQIISLFNAIPSYEEKFRVMKSIYPKDRILTDRQPQSSTIRYFLRRIDEECKYKVLLGTMKRLGVKVGE